MKIRSLFILLMVLVIFSGTASAARHRQREHRLKTVRNTPAYSMSGKMKPAQKWHQAPRGGPLNPYSSRGHIMKPYRDSKTIRGGGRGQIRVLP